MQQTTRKDGNIAIEQVEGYLKDAPSTLDKERGQALGLLASVKRAKLVQTRRERARAEARYGKDDPRVAKADLRMRREHQLLVNTRAESDRSSVSKVEREDAVWKLHGFVRNQEGTPISDATVLLYPDRDGHKDALMQVQTDARGYFSLNYTPDLGDAEESEEELSLLRESAGMQINTSLYRIRKARAAIAQPVYLGARAGADRSVDGRVLYPTPGNVVYRDIELDVAQTEACRLRTRYLGNSNTRELHDLKNEKPGCRIAEMRVDHRVYVKSEKQAEAMGYDYCAHCFGPERSRR